MLGFGYEWTRFDHSEADPAELRRNFELYFSLFPWDELPASARGFDLGCGSGRWSALASEWVGTLICVDPSPDALGVAIVNAPRAHFLLSAAGELPFPPGSMDFGYSLGVLHHTPDPLVGLRDAVSALKPGAPLLVYLYYALDNRPLWYRGLWRITDLLRIIISRAPTSLRYGISQIIALTVYWPLSRLARVAERRGKDVNAFPLAAYRAASFYTMRNDALDRFGTRLEKRFRREQVEALMENAGLNRVVVATGPPYWLALGFRP